MIYSYLFNRFQITADVVDVRRHFPEDFVVRFSSDGDRDRVLASRPGGPLLPLVWRPWRRTSLATADSFRFRVLLGISRLPLHARSVDTAQAILGAAYANVELTNLRDTAEDDDREFFVTAWCASPALINEDSRIFIPEPLVRGIADEGRQALPGLSYLVRVRLVAFQDGGSDNDGGDIHSEGENDPGDGSDRGGASSGPDVDDWPTPRRDSEDNSPDSNYNGFHPGFASSPAADALRPSILVGEVRCPLKSPLRSNVRLSTMRQTSTCAPETPVYQRSAGSSTVSVSPTLMVLRSTDYGNAGLVGQFINVAPHLLMMGIDLQMPQLAGDAASDTALDWWADMAEVELHGPRLHSPLQEPSPATPLGVQMPVGDDLTSAGILQLPVGVEPADDLLARGNQLAQDNVVQMALAWRRDFCTVSDVSRGLYSLNAKISGCSSLTPWWITVIYEPRADADKVAFLDELRQFGTTVSAPWMLCDDFNMIYRAQDKSNDRIDRRCLRRFRTFLNQAKLDEIFLVGRKYTWSNEQEQPTLVLLDRVFVTTDWLGTFPNHVLKPLSTDCSDHCPLLLLVLEASEAKRRFIFQPYWVRIPGFIDVVASAWGSYPQAADPCRVLDHKLRNVAKALKSWSSKKVGSIKLQLALVREVILAFDAEQDSRALLPWEAELRRSLKLQVLGLASLARTIARQKSRVLFLAEGDANTKFYHLQACHRGRKSRIETLSVEGTKIISDRGMADALFQYYNEILEVDFERSARIDLAAIGVPSLPLDDLEVPFTEDEVRGVINDMPNDKAPGPDGFTALFYKKAWDIIKQDVMLAVNAFWALDYRSFHHLNDAYMILLKKKSNPAVIKDYRPISLIHSFGKLITKCLARRLATVLDRLVLNNQTAFIKGRSIHDNVRSVQLTCKALHQRQSSCLLLKIDIAKAFDTLAWTFLLDVLRHLGFGQRWRDWVSIVLSSASTKIMLNGRPGHRICHARGLRQGDPLSPMLFVLAMEVFNNLLRWVEQTGRLTPVVGIVGSRLYLYADDLVMFLKPLHHDLQAVKASLSIFGRASGLFANLEKSTATPIHCAVADLDRVRQVLACAIEGFPCRYLGVQLTVHRLRRSEEQSLIDKVAARIPGWKGSLLNVAGRTALVMATMSAIPIHTSIALCLSPWAIDAIDKLRRSFIWTGTDSVAGGKCKVAWSLVCRPKELGGLGISDLRRTGVALRIRWVWKDRQTGAAPNTKDRVALALFDAATVLQLGDGKATSGQIAGFRGVASSPSRPTFSLPFGRARDGAWLRMLSPVMLGFATYRDLSQCNCSLSSIKSVTCCAMSSSQTLRTPSTGGFLAMAPTRPPRRMGLCSLAPRCPLAPRKSGRLQPRRACASSSGWCCIGAAGLLNDVSVTVCRAPRLVSCVTSCLRRSITFYWAAASARKSGICASTGCACRILLQSMRSMSCPGGFRTERASSKSSAVVSTHSSYLWAGHFGRNETQELLTQWLPRLRNY
jgi:hypothetical protein